MKWFIWGNRFDIGYRARRFPTFKTFRTLYWAVVSSSLPILYAANNCPLLSEHYKKLEVTVPITIKLMFFFRDVIYVSTSLWYWKFYADAAKNV